MPAVIISDRDKIFISQLWQDLFKLSGVTLKMSSAYHPQTDGQTERVNQCMETFLRCFVHACPKQWFQWLHLAEFWYNSSWHSALGTSPFQALYGHSPRSFGISAADASKVTSLSDWLAERNMMQQLIKQHLARAQDRMKKQADKNRSGREFNEGDMVFLKLQPYVQSSVATSSSQKLAFKFFGPFQVLKRIGKVAYKLQLPASSSVHPVFHVSQLKAAPPSNQQVIAELPDLGATPQTPQRILQYRGIPGGPDPRFEVLIQWTGTSPALATWENLDDLRRRFPASPALEVAGSFAGGVLALHLCPLKMTARRLVGREGVKGFAGPTRVYLGLSGNDCRQRSVCVVKWGARELMRGIL
jgi:hypothetical protein